MEINLFAGLPLEIIKSIISYDERLKYRNGKWMNQIDKKDKRLLLYDTIPKPYVNLHLPRRHEGDFHISITFISKKQLKQLYIYSYWVGKKETIRYLFRRFGYREPDDLWIRV